MDNPLLIAPGVFAVFLTVLGLVVGSFLNVVIARVPEGQSIVHPRSRCPHCGHMITWYENIPVLSWLWLRGKCSNCKSPISVRYPLIELLTGVLFLACLRRFGWEYPLVPALLLVTLLVPLTFIDLEYWLLPFELTMPGIVLGIATAIPMGGDHVRDCAIGAASAFFGFWLTEKIGAAVFKKEALGGGDKWLLALIGAFLTWRAVLVVIIFASVQGAVVGITLLLIYGRAGPAPKPKEAPAPGTAATPPATGADAAPATAALSQPSPTPETPAPAVEASAAPTADAKPPPAEVPTASALPAPAAAPVASTEPPSTPPVTPTSEAAAKSEAPNDVASKAEAPNDAASKGEAPKDGAPQGPGEAKLGNEEGDDWVPGPTNIPFGPWLALGALEVMLLGPWIAEYVPPIFAWMFGADPY